MKYNVVYSRIWTQPEFRALTEDGRLAALYVMTCPQRNTEGLFRLPMPLAQHDLGWDLERNEAAFKDLAESGIIEYDRESDMVFLPSALRNDPPKGKNRLKGAVNQLAEVPETVLCRSFLALCSEVCPELGGAIAGANLWPAYPFEAPSKPLRDGIREPSGTPSNTHSHSHSHPHHRDTSDVDNTKPVENTDDGDDDDETVAAFDWVARSLAIDRATLNPTEQATIRQLVAAGITPETIGEMSDVAADKDNPRSYLRTCLKNKLAEVAAAADADHTACCNNQRMIFPDDGDPYQCPGF